MAFKVKPYKELVALSKEKLDSALAPMRARMAKAKAALESAKIEERMVSLEGEIQKLCTEKELDLEKIVGKLNEYALAERKAKQIKELIAALFPDK